MILTKNSNFYHERNSKLHVHFNNNINIEKVKISRKVWTWLRLKFVGDESITL